MVENFPRYVFAVSCLPNFVSVVLLVMAVQKIKAMKAHLHERYDPKKTLMLGATFFLAAFVMLWLCIVQ
jgi:uncharacterized membrane protein